MMILGIDPGIAKLWYALITPPRQVVEAGIITTWSTAVRIKQYERMHEIVQFFAEMIKKYPEIKTVCIEKYFFTQYNKSNAEFVYGVRGALLMLCFEHKISVLEYTPLQLKKMITGNGKADKKYMQQMIMKLYQLKDIPLYHDAADALWLALLGSRR